VITVLTGVFRKRALATRNLLPAAFRIRITAAAIFCNRAGGAGDRRRADRSLPWTLMTLEVITIAQISPFSLCIPFPAFTPVFLIPTTYLILGQTPQPSRLLGVALIVIGSRVVHRQWFAVGWPDHGAADCQGACQRLEAADRRGRVSGRVPAGAAMIDYEAHVKV
jgi:hypothetical protein